MVVEIAHTLDQLIRNPLGTELDRQRTGPLNKIFRDLDTISYSYETSLMAQTGTQRRLPLLQAAHSLLVTSGFVACVTGKHSLAVGCWADGFHERRQARQGTSKGIRSSLVYMR